MRWDSARATSPVLEDRLRLIPDLVTKALGLLAQVYILEVSNLIGHVKAQAGIEQVSPYCQRRARRPRNAFTDIHAPIVSSIAQIAMIRPAMHIIQTAAGLDNISAL